MMISGGRAGERAGTAIEQIRAALSSAAARIGGDTARLDAELLMAHAAGLSRDDILLGRIDAVPDGFGELVTRRAAGEPVAYIVGHRDFWDMTLAVTPAVLIPRPDSETLIEAAIAHFADTAGPATILDLGTGSGALLLAALRVWPEAAGIGVDRSPDVLAVATGNAATLGLADRATFVEGRWDACRRPFDLVLCNPPYIATQDVLPRDVVGHEPHIALFAGDDGLADYRVIAPLLPTLIADGGVACVEIGATQAAAVTKLIVDHGLRTALARDLSGRDRCVIVRR